MTLEQTEDAKELETGFQGKGDRRLITIPKSRKGAEFALRIKVSGLDLVSFICPEDIRVERLSSQWGNWSSNFKGEVEAGGLNLGVTSI